MCTMNLSIISEHYLSEFISIKIIQEQHFNKSKVYQYNNLL